MPVPPGVRGVLLDIEGTTTPISFVYDVLFPYARGRLARYCALAGSRPEIAAAVEQLRREHAEETADGAGEFGDGAAYARRLMEQDRKSTGLKLLQGLIWQDGYASGELRGQVFADVPGALRRWREAGLRLRIFSSGSVLAQKLLFSTTEHGDLTGCFDGFHDTTTGPKQQPESYRAIAEAFGLPPSAVLFLSDVTAELDAAAAAGMRTGLTLRPGNKPAAAGTHPVHRDLGDLL